MSIVKEMTITTVHTEKSNFAGSPGFASTLQGGMQCIYQHTGSSITRSTTGLSLEENTSLTPYFHKILQHLQHPSETNNQAMPWPPCFRVPVAAQSSPSPWRAPCPTAQPQPSHGAPPAAGHVGTLGNTHRAFSSGSGVHVPPTF